MVFFFFFINNSLLAQSAKDEIIKGNEAYKKNDFSGAENFYRGALKIVDSNTTANYNLGNTLYRKDNTEEAVQAYDNTIQNSR